MILFITRKYPPAVGGMENLSYHLTTEIARRQKAIIIAWGHSQKWLPLFAIWAFFRGLVCLFTNPIRFVHIGDPVLSPVGLALRLCRRTPIFVTAHGLDVTFSHPVYQWMLRICLKRLDGVVCISSYARSECLQRGVSVDRCVVIHPGIQIDPSDEPGLKALSDLERICGRGLTGRKIVLSVGRLVERKGIDWFVRAVMPDLARSCPDVIYLICGDGPRRSFIEAEIERLALSSYVCLLGHVTSRLLHIAYTCADVFVMPNIRISGNPEGFGLVTLEARAAGIPVIAADVEGIGESITPGADGWLVGSGDAAAFVEILLKVLGSDSGLWSRAQIRAHIRETANWSTVADKYLKQFETWTEYLNKRKETHP